MGHVPAGHFQFDLRIKTFNVSQVYISDGHEKCLCIKRVVLT